MNGSQLFASSSPIAVRVASIAASGGGDVGVEVLEPQNVRVVPRRRRDAVDVEPRDLLETRDAHRLLLASAEPKLAVIRRRRG